MVGSPMWIFCAFFFLLGLIMFVRGWIYTLKPQSGIALKRQQKNMRLGFTANMPVFGRKIRRLGLILMILSGLGLSRFL